MNLCLLTDTMALVARFLSAAEPAISAAAVRVSRVVSSVRDRIDEFTFPPVAPQLQLAGLEGQWLPVSNRAHDDADDVTDDGSSGQHQRGLGLPAGLSGGLIEALTTGFWFAVPKRKKSYARKRQRQMNPLYAEHNIQVCLLCRSSKAYHASNPHSLQTRVDCYYVSACSPHDVS